MNIFETAAKYKSVIGFIKYFINSILSITKVVLLSKYKTKLPSLQGNQSCIILGNGPSLKDSVEKYKSVLQTNDLICVNHFAEHEWFTEFKPKHYVLLDYAFFDTKHTLDKIKKFYPFLIEKCTWPIYLYIPTIFRKSALLEPLKKNKNIQIVPFNYIISNGFSGLNQWLYKKNLAMPLCNTVLNAAVFLSINLNYKKIYIVGADHDWFQNIRIDENNELFIYDKHFYGDQENSKAIAFNKTPLGKKVRITDVFINGYKGFLCYYTLDDYAKKIGSKVYNSSAFSMIDAFERKSLDELKK